ncbi:helix-turn-helix domain-containing protein [Mycobacterium yunnanensis]|uniref:Helix-turn-helix domain-containing protein n=1 Tax=Mycobacterium yunnanensis TaxID=368477 RepID=A0A9X2YKB4_9MYCO|nr:LuxR family transcriptional regulator [Mycobacterium yunnanensis]MCV7420973.1 helix-turn-helix domain-containing protein [Mycobacterium yunnanensis]
MTHLIGREVELDRIAAFLARARRDGDVRLVRGEPGAGKSALLDAAADRARAVGMHVLRASGSELDAHVAYAGLNQLLLPLRNALTHLDPEAQQALSVALGFGSGPPPTPLRVCNAALSLVIAVAHERPALLLVDDVPQVDRASAAAFGFIARRVQGHPVGMVLSYRTGEDCPFDRMGLTEQLLAPLDDAASAQLVDATWPDLPSRVRRRVLGLARGNPLALVELPTVLNERTLPTDDQPVVAPLSDRLRSLFESRVADLPEATRRLLLSAAIEGDGDVKAHLVLTASRQSDGPRRASPEVVKATSGLTSQELHVAHLAASGLTNRQIGERLYLSHRTVGAHLYRVFPKLGVSSRAGLRDALSDPDLGRMTDSHRRH